MFDFLYIKHDANLKAKEVHYEQLTENITIAFCNNKSTNPNAAAWQANFENTKEAMRRVKELLK